VQLLYNCHLHCSKSCDTECTTWGFVLLHCACNAATLTAQAAYTCSLYTITAYMQYTCKQGGQNKPRRPSTAPPATTTSTTTTTTAIVVAQQGADAAASRVVQRTPGEEFSMKLTDRSKAVINRHGRMKLTYRYNTKSLNMPTCLSSAAHNSDGFWLLQCYIISCEACLFEFGNTV
jgi:hypothetical protein